jgi:hypothetical protein
MRGGGVIEGVRDAPHVWENERVRAHSWIEKR